jgi:hypothetical protein
MNPKISDFGLAKIFSLNDTEQEVFTNLADTMGNTHTK